MLLKDHHLTLIHYLEEEFGFSKITKWNNLGKKNAALNFSLLGIVIRL